MFVGDRILLTSPHILVWDFFRTNDLIQDVHTLFYVELMTLVLNFILVCILWMLIAWAIKLSIFWPYQIFWWAFCNKPVLSWNILDDIIVSCLEYILFFLISEIIYIDIYITYYCLFLLVDSLFQTTLLE